MHTYNADALYIQTSKLLGNQKPPQLVEVECRIWRSIFRIAQNKADVCSEMQELSSWITVKESDLRRDESKFWFKLAEASTAIDMSWTSADIDGPLPSGWAIPHFLNTSVSSLESAIDQPLTAGRGDENINQDLNQDLQAGSSDDRDRREPDGGNDEDMGKEVNAPDGDGDEDMGAPDGDGDMGAPHGDGDMGAPHGDGDMGAPDGDEDMGAPEGDSHEGVAANDNAVMDDFEEDDAILNSIDPDNSPVRRSARQKSAPQSSLKSTAQSILTSKSSTRRSKTTRNQVAYGSAVERPIDVDLLFV
jgi:hypothetical protein